MGPLKLDRSSDFFHTGPIENYHLSQTKTFKTSAWAWEEKKNQKPPSPPTKITAGWGCGVSFICSTVCDHWAKLGAQCFRCCQIQSTTLKHLWSLSYFVTASLTVKAAKLQSVKSREAASKEHCADGRLTPKWSSNWPIWMWQNVFVHPIAFAVGMCHWSSGYTDGSAALDVLTSNEWILVQG